MSPKMCVFCLPFLKIDRTDSKLTWIFAHGWCACERYRAIDTKLPSTTTPPDIMTWFHCIPCYSKWRFRGKLISISHDFPCTVKHIERANGTNLATTNALWCGNKHSSRHMNHRLYHTFTHTRVCTHIEARHSYVNVRMKVPSTGCEYRTTSSRSILYIRICAKRQVIL